QGEGHWRGRLRGGPVTSRRTGDRELGALEAVGIAVEALAGVELHRALRGLQIAAAAIDGTAPRAIDAVLRREIGHLEPRRTLDLRGLLLAHRRGDGRYAPVPRRSGVAGVAPRLAVDGGGLVALVGCGVDDIGAAGACRPLVSVADPQLAAIVRRATGTF